MIQVNENVNKQIQTVVLMAQTLQEWKFVLPHKVMNTVHLRQREYRMDNKNKLVKISATIMWPFTDMKTVITKRFPS